MISAGVDRNILVYDDDGTALGSATVQQIVDLGSGGGSVTASSFTTFTNKDAGGTITLTLIAGSANYRVSFVVHTAEELRIDPDGAEQFVDFTHSSTGGKYLVSSTVGSAIELTWDGTKWQIVSIIGIWDEEA